MINDEGLLQQQVGTEEDPLESFFTVDAKIQFTVRDKYSGASVGNGKLNIYDPANPGSSLEEISVATGTGTSARFYESGTQLGVVYDQSSATFLPYSWLITAPYAKSDDAGQTLDCDTIFEVISAPARADWGMWIQKAGTDVWSNDSAAVANAFDPQTDDDDVSLGIRSSVTGDNEGFAYTEGWYDYSEDNADLQNRKSYWVISFSLNASGTSMSASDLNSYLKFGDLGGGIRLEFFGDTVVLVKEITTETQAGVRDTDTQGNTQRGLTGNAVVWTLEFDFGGGIGNTDWGDEILIGVSVVSGFALDYAMSHDSLTQTGDSPEGDMGSDFSNRCSIG